VTPGASPTVLGTVLAEAQRRGFIGPGPIEPHLAHAQAFLDALAGAPAGHVVDLGSGGGLPALVLADWEPGRSFLLVESQQRRAAFLQEAITQLGIVSRVQVAHGRAEEVARAHLGEAAVVTARAFGPPSVTAECAAPFLREGGWLLVSEPPAPDAPDGTSARWPADGLAVLGQELGPRWERRGATVQVIVQAAPPPAWVPRRIGVAAKRPVFVEGSR
jgi:16S rRNA (guanine527-N7)-methyltransferase